MGIQESFLEATGCVMMLPLMTIALVSNATCAVHSQASKISHFSSLVMVIDIIHGNKKLLGILNHFEDYKTVLRPQCLRTAGLGVTVSLPGAGGSRFKSWMCLVLGKPIRDLVSSSVT